jgi:hypothetical protein
MTELPSRMKQFEQVIETASKFKKRMLDKKASPHNLPALRRRALRLDRRFPKPLSHVLHRQVRDVDDGVMPMRLYDQNFKGWLADFTFIAGPLVCRRPYSAGCICEVRSMSELKEWRCFHCDEVFTDRKLACAHFGATEDAKPACQIKMGAERSLVEALREAEKAADDAWQAIHSESTESAKAYYAATSRHRKQLTAAEELGYERGLADGRALVETVAKSATVDPTFRIEPDWAAHCASKSEGYEDGLRAASRIVDAYGRAAHAQSLKDMAPIISKTILRTISHPSPVPDAGPSEIPRFAFQMYLDEDSDIQADPNGEYVLYEDHIAALRSVTVAAPPLRVKALEWERSWDEDGNDWLEAGSPFHAYTITFTPRSNLPYVLRPFGLNLDSNYATMDDAKSAAQAHYEQRIRSALVEAPVSEAVSTAEPVSVTVKYVAILERHDRRGKKAVIVPDGQSLEFDEDSTTRRWLYPYLGNEYHLNEFLPVEPSALPRVQAPAEVMGWRTKKTYKHPPLSPLRCR